MLLKSYRLVHVLSEKPIMNNKKYSNIDPKIVYFIYYHATCHTASLHTQQSAYTQGRDRSHEF